MDTVVAEADANYWGYDVLWVRKHAASSLFDEALSVEHFVILVTCPQHGAVGWWAYCGCVVIRSDLKGDKTVWAMVSS